MRTAVTTVLSPRPQSVLRLTTVSVFAVFASLASLTEGALAQTATDRPPTVNAVSTPSGFRFEPTTISAPPDGRVRICNRSKVFSRIFSLSKGNEFGGRKGVQLPPGACTIISLSNRAGLPADVSVFDYVHSRAKITVTVAAQTVSCRKSPISQTPVFCPLTESVASSTVATVSSTIVPTVVPTGLMLESARPAAGVLWAISGDGKTATFTGPFGTQISEFPAPDIVPAAGVTFTWTLTATASVSNLATECEVKGSGFVATATPGLHAAAFSPTPGQTNVMKVAITLKPASLSPGATAQLYVGCFSNYGFFFEYKAK